MREEQRAQRQVPGGMRSIWIFHHPLGDVPAVTHTCSHLVSESVTGLDQLRHMVPCPPGDK